MAIRFEVNLVAVVSSESDWTRFDPPSQVKVESLRNPRQCEQTVGAVHCEYDCRQVLRIGTIRIENRTGARAYPKPIPKAQIT